MEVREARTESELTAALALRERIFCGEQGVSFEADQDGRDPEATHIVAVDDGVRDRHLPPAVPRRTSRGSAGSRWSATAAATASPPRSSTRPTGSPRQAGSESIALHAQTYALPLYERAGYEPYGPTFVEEGIEHVAMEKRLA